MKILTQRSSILATLSLTIGVGLVGCQESEPISFRIRAAERGGLHHTQTIPVSVSAPPGTSVELTLEPDNCGTFDTTSPTTNEFGSGRAVFTAGVVEQDCTVEVSGTLEGKTARTTIQVHPPAVTVEVAPWEDPAPAPQIEIAPKVSPDQSSGNNRFEYFISQSQKNPIQSISLTLATESTVHVTSALSANFVFMDPLPNASSEDQKTWTLSEGGPFNSVTLEAHTAGQPGGTATFEVVVEQGGETSLLILTPTGPQ
jgi:hypothetical protein